MCKLTEEDKYWLRVNFYVAPESSPEDPQGKLIYTVEENLIDEHSPVWTSDEVERIVRDFAERWSLRIKLRWHDDRYRGSYSFTGRGGGVVFLERRRTSGQFCFVDDGHHLASIVLHELAHILTPSLWPSPIRYNSIDFQSHGPEFARCYLMLLSDYIDIGKATEAFAYMEIEVAAPPKVVRNASIVSELPIPPC